MLPDEVVLVSSASCIKRHLEGFGCHWEYIIITNPTYSMHRKLQCTDCFSNVVIEIRVYNKICWTEIEVVRPASGYSLMMMMMMTMLMSFILLLS